jgi:hypothetical protein
MRRFSDAIFVFSSCTLRNQPIPTFSILLKKACKFYTKGVILPSPPSSLLALDTTLHAPLCLTCLPENSTVGN